MAYNKDLDDRIAEIASGWEKVGRKNMFGGVCYLLNGNMVCGVHKDYLVLRLGEKAAREAYANPFVRPFDITGRPMRGWVMVEEQGFQGEDLRAWLDQALAFTRKLPPK
jgi:hypothetical protein